MFLKAKVDEKLEREIMGIPAIDIHSHISSTSPKAAHLSDILLHHYIATELITAAMLPSLLKGNLSDEHSCRYRCWLYSCNAYVLRNVRTEKN